MSARGVKAMFQRVLSGLVLILMGAAGAVLLRPDLFPDIALPSFLAEAGFQRAMLGLILSGATALILLGLATGGLRDLRAGRREPAYSPGPLFEPEESSPSTSAYALATPVEAGVPTEVAAERSWAPLPPLRVVESQAKAQWPAPAQVSDEAQPEAEPESEPESNALTPPTASEPVPEAESAVVEPEPDLTVATAAEPVGDQGAKLAELTAAADAAKAEGRTEEATDLYEDALSEARLQHAANPTDLAAQAAVAEALGRVALMVEDDNRLELALQRHEESLSLYRSIAASAPEEPRWAKGLVAALGRLADCREVRGHRSRARDLYAEAVAITKRLTWLQPGSQAYASAFAQAKTRFAELDAELQGEPV